MPCISAGVMKVTNLTCHFRLAILGNSKNDELPSLNRHIPSWKNFSFDEEILHGVHQRSK